MAKRDGISLDQLLSSAVAEKVSVLEGLDYLKAQAARELAPYRSKMGVVQLRQVEQQFVHKRLLEHYRLPRLSLFYMSQQ